MAHNRLDPRNFQLTTLLILLGILLFWRQIEWETSLLSLILITCIASQWLGTRFASLPRFEVKSALISCFSLMLLLKSTHIGWVCFVASAAILSKFTLRAHDRHLFNPTNFGLALGLLLTDQVWLSHGQWGHGPFWVFFACCTGTFVLFLAQRSDITLSFITFWAALIFGRALYLGDPMPIPLHSMQNGALLIFAFFMISDPKTTPDTRLGRILFAGIVAIAAYIMQYHFYNPNGLIYALAFLSPLTLLINRWLPGPSYQWPENINTSPTFLPKPSTAGATS